MNTIIEKIRAEVLRLIRETDGPGSQYGFGKMSACNRILNFLDTLQEQPVCEECPSRGNTHSYLKGLEDGKKEMREQLMKEAVERIVKEDAGGYPYIDATELYDYTEDKPLAKKGDKVKIIIIKEN